MEIEKKETYDILEKYFQMVVARRKKEKRECVIKEFGQGIVLFLILLCALSIACVPVICIVYVTLRVYIEYGLIYAFFGFCFLLTVYVYIYVPGAQKVITIFEKIIEVL